MGPSPGRQVVPLRPLGGTELLDAAVRAVWAQRRAVLPITAPVAVLITALGAVLNYVTIGDTNARLLSSGGTLLLQVLAGVLVAGMVAPAISRGLLGEQLSAGQCLRAVGRNGVGLVVLAVLVMLGEGVGLALLVVGGAWLWGVWAVVGPAATLEHLGPFAAMRRSFRLVSDDFWRVWGVRALGWAVALVIRLVAAIPFQVLAIVVARVHSLGQSDQSVGKPGVYVAVISIGAVIGALVTIPLSAAIDVLLYTDLRMRKEGMDIVMALPARADGGLPMDRSGDTAPDPLAAPGPLAAPW